MAVLIKNGTVVTAEGEGIADVYVKGETIAAVGEDLQPGAGDEVVDATGKYILPGGVDQHVHLSFTYNGSKVRGFETSNAAAVGAFYSVVPFVAEYPDSPHISFLKIHFIFPNDESGQTRKIIFPTTSLCSTQPTSELRESTLLSRWSPSTKYVPAGTT